MEVISVSGLTKTYKVKQQREGFIGGIKDLVSPIYSDKEALKGINLSIRSGETIGYIGPNGSGKSTTIKILTGILTPTSGNVSVNGIVPYKDRIANAKNIGVVIGQRTQLRWDLAIRESFELFRHIYHIPDSIYKYNLDRMVSLLALDEFYSTPVRNLSLGQRMRAEIACAFFHNPSIVFLDEPTIGLDVVAKEQVRLFLRDINKENNTTIILTTHDMDDIEQVCERLILLDGGNILIDQKMKEFTERYGKDRVLIVQLENNVGYPVLSNGKVISNEDKQLKILFNRDQISASSLIQEVTSQMLVIDCKIEEPKIEHLIRDIYQGRSGQRSA